MSAITISKLKQTFVLLISFLIVTIKVNGQSGNVVIIDSKSKETIPFANVCIEELGSNQKFYHISDKDGAVKNLCKNKALISVSFVGYKTYKDTIQPNKSYQIALIPQVFDLDQVIVTANFIPQKADKSIYNVKVIDSRKIEMKAATNLSDILKDEVNFQVSYDPALGSSLKLKGLSGNNVKILVDGVPVIGRLGGNIDLSQLNLYNIDHVEIVEGPMSVIYGSNALAGAINIITKENLHSNYNVTANTYLENLGTYNFDGIVAFKSGKNNFSFSGGRNFFNGVYLENIDKNRSQTWKPKEQYNADFYYVYNQDKYKIKYQSSFMNERLLDKGDQFSPWFRYANDSWFKSLRFTNRIEYNLKIGNDYFLNVWGSHSFYERKKLTYQKDFIDSSSQLVNDNSSNDTTKSNAFAYKLLFGNQNPEKLFNFVSGIDLNYETASGKRILDEKQSIGDYAIFTSLMLNLGKTLSIQPGFRYDYNTKFNSPPVPSINVKWNVFSFLNIRASYTRGYRAPSIKELYILFKDVNHDIRPNDTLKAERGNNFDLSFSFNTDKTDKIHFTNVELSMFYNQIDNIIYLAPITTLPVGTFYKYINISYFNTFGGQVAFKYSFYPRFDLGFGFGETGTYASTDVKNQRLGRYKYGTDASINTSYLIPKLDVKVYLNYKYSGVKFNPSLDSNNQIVFGSINPFTTIDISLMKKFFSNKLTISCGLKNLLDNKIVLSKGVTGDTPHTGGDGSPVGYGRVFFTSITYNIFN
ncbi:MAG: TonB-dependent receptor [Bacteroidales bacterium]|nr:TonB-dependent receptor [Bacteroidales bacterium]